MQGFLRAIEETEKKIFQDDEEREREKFREQREWGKRR